jgi:hypothetical protein
MTYTPEDIEAMKEEEKEAEYVYSSCASTSESDE